MKSLRKLTPLFRLLFASLVLVIALVLLYRGASGPTNAQQSTPQERQIENTIPKHVPIEVKITKEKEKNWKDLKNENWAHDFELEITNTGQKPIYALALLLFFDVPNEYQDYLVTEITYRSPGISNTRSIATADDVPIKPGESKVFKLDPNQVLSWDKRRREKGYRLPTKVKIMFQLLSFGDGTGLVLDAAVPDPKPSSETSKLDNFTPQPRRGKRANVNWRSITRYGGARDEKNHTSLPAVLPVNYFRATSRLTARDAAFPVDECAPGCFPVAHDFEVPCYGCSIRPSYWYTNDQSRPCGNIYFPVDTCMDTGTGELQPCQYTQATVCMSEPAPTPRPTATPSPPPPPVCYSCSSDAQCSCPNVHCDLNNQFCSGNYYNGCDQHSSDDCYDSIGYFPIDPNNRSVGADRTPGSAYNRNRNPGNSCE